MTGEHTDGAAATPAGNATRTPDARLRWGTRLLGLTGLLFVGQGASSTYRSLTSDQLESGVPHLDGSTGAELAASNPELAAYVSHLQVNGAALAAIVGVAMLALVWYGVREGRRWAWATTVAMPLAYLGVLVPLHLASGFDYHSLQHLGPVAIGVPIVVAGAILAYQGLDTTTDTTHATTP